jgi:hypothetical protein
MFHLSPDPTARGSNSVRGIGRRKPHEESRTILSEKRNVSPCVSKSNVRRSCKSITARKMTGSGPHSPTTTSGCSPDYRADGAEPAGEPRFRLVVDDSHPSFFDRWRWRVSGSPRS